MRKSRSRSGPNRANRGAMASVPRRRLSIGFALLAVLPLLGVILLLDRSGAIGREVLFGFDGLIAMLTLASVIGGFALVRNELGRVLETILVEAHRRAGAQAAARSDGGPEELRTITASIAQIGERLERLREVVAYGNEPEEAPAPSSTPASSPPGLDAIPVAEALLAAKGPDDLGTVLREILRALRAEFGYLVVPDEGRGEFVTIAAAGEGAEVLSGLRIPLGEGVPAAAARERTPLLLSNPESPGADAAHDVMAVPLLSEEILLGVLVVQDPTDGAAFRTLDLEELSGFCKLIVKALGRFRPEPARPPTAPDTIDEILRMYAREIDERNPYTRGHSERVARYCEEMARALGLEEESIRIVRRAALLHDIGKLLLPESIIRKEGRLTDEELELMRTHADRADTMVRRVAGFEEIAPLVRHHHERCDGSGYPDGVKGEDLPLETHLLIVANAFDVMTSDRSYRQATSLLQALRTLQEGAGTTFDRRAVQALCGLDRDVLTAPTDHPVTLGSAVTGQGTASISILE